MKSLLFFAAFAAVIVAAVSAQSISVGSGNIIYQILFSQWQNPQGKLFTGKYCNYIASKCQTKFVGYVDVRPSSDAKDAALTWPGPKNVDKWPVIGKKYYSENSLNDFAYLNLTGVDQLEWADKSPILRVKVIDSGYVTSNEINCYLGDLPSLDQLNVTKYESDAKFSQPIELDSLSVALPSAIAKGYKTDRTTDQQQHLFVKVRAWGADLKKSANVQSDSSSSGSSDEADVNNPKGTYCNRRCRRNRARKASKGNNKDE